jgi:hypothetical protein
MKYDYYRCGVDKTILINKLNRTLIQIFFKILIVLDSGSEFTIQDHADNQVHVQKYI